METIRKIHDVCASHEFCAVCRFNNPSCLFMETPKKWDVEKIERCVKDDNLIPFMLHKQTGCPIGACVEAYDEAIEYLRGKSELKGGVKNGTSNT